MPKFVNVVTIEVAPGRRNQVATLLAAHKARCLKGEPGTLQFEVFLVALHMSAFGGKGYMTRT